MRAVTPARRRKIARKVQKIRRGSGAVDGVSAPILCFLCSSGAGGVWVSSMDGKESGYICWKLWWRVNKVKGGGKGRTESDGGFLRVSWEFSFYFLFQELKWLHGRSTRACLYTS